MPLPPNFVFGAATSAYQIEGDRPGRDESIWDRFSDQGRLTDRGDVAADHVRRFTEDIALMADLGIDAYRMSISWTRVRRSGLGFYNELIDGLLAAGITPWVTLFHWDLPGDIEDQGGWPERRTVDAFIDYTATVVDGLGDRVKNWITINEPWVAATLGYIDGVFAPGRQSWPDGLAAGHHLLLAHGRAVELIRDRLPQASVGIALDCRPAWPSSADPADTAAAHHFDGFRNRWFFDPVFGRGYPADMEAAFAERGRWDGSVVQAGDLQTISAQLDFLGINYYTGIAVSAGGEESESTGVERGPNPPAGFTEMGWEVIPKALTDFLIRVHQDYQPKAIVITENGASYSDPVDDHRRIEYLDLHLSAVEEAIGRGAPVTGYFVWSLLDNLEWVAGFGQRFGLIHVDFETGTRTPKASFSWYRARIRG